MGARAGASDCRGIARRRSLRIERSRNAPWASGSPRTTSSRQVDGLVVYRLDRLARDLILQEQLLADVWRQGCKVFSTSRAEGEYLSDDPADPSRKLIRQILGSVAEYERAMISLRLRAGRARKAENGGYAGGRPPFGFRAKGRQLVPLEEEQRVLQRIQELHEQGCSAQSIADTLMAEGLRPRSAEVWHSRTVTGILARLAENCHTRPLGLSHESNQRKGVR